MARRLTSLTVQPGRNPLRRWYRYRNPARVAFNFALIWTAKFLPSLRVKNLLYQIAGVRIGRNVGVAFGAMLDPLFPELITLNDGCVVGFNATILTHEFLPTAARKGPVHVGKRALVGAGALVLPGVTIGDGAIVSALSLVNRDVLPGEKVAGVPIQTVRANSGRARS